MRIQNKKLADSWGVGSSSAVDHVRTVGLRAVSEGCSNGIVFCSAQSADMKIVVTTESESEIDYMIDVLESLRKQKYGRSK